MLNRKLPAHHNAGQVVSPYKEPAVPSDWPGAYCPNFSDWKPGDIVLVHAGNDATGTLITTAQIGSIKRAIRKAATVTHTGIYIGNGELIDAVPGRPVDVVSIWNYCQSRELELRRVPNVNGQDIATEAKTYVGMSYSIWQVVLSKLIPNHAANPAALYCSTLVGVAVTNATGISLDSDPTYQPLHPASLASHQGLVTVALEWRNF